MPSTAGDGAGNCDLEIDDDGVQMWAADNDGSARDAGRVASGRARLREVSRGWRRSVGNASTPLACSGSDNQQLDIYAMYSYDATFALAHALHRLVEHARVAEARGACAHAAPTRTGPCTPPGSSLSTLRREGRLPPLVSVCVCVCVEKPAGSSSPRPHPRCAATSSTRRS